MRDVRPQLQDAAVLAPAHAGAAPARPGASEAAAAAAARAAARPPLPTVAVASPGTRALSTADETQSHLYP